jgi:uncharacterized DUF497 family protein
MTIFNNPLAKIFDDEVHSENEKREIIIGHSILFIVIASKAYYTRSPHFRFFFGYLFH